MPGTEPHSLSTAAPTLRESCVALFTEAQARICAGLEAIDGKAAFSTENWQRPETDGTYGGGGVTRVIRHGAVFEQGGVNFSSVQGTLPAEMSEKLLGVRSPQPFFATGISLVIHPYSPIIPTTHANFRYLEVADRKWFGGGGDLTPYCLFEDDARHFHQTFKSVCDRFDPEFYPRHKKECDEYFYLPHRGETRGVGGIFFDYIGRDDPSLLAKTFPLVQELAGAFLPAYLPIVERRKCQPFTAAQKEFQLIRRGRYVEFNLLYDRGTLFGLKTSGRTESILMSLPPEVRWEYGFEPLPGTAEAKLLEVLRNPRDWV